MCRSIQACPPSESRRFFPAFTVCDLARVRHRESRVGLATFADRNLPLQFRDLRAKARTGKTESAGDIRPTQKQLGYVSVISTEKYVRRQKGAKAAPTGQEKLRKSAEIAEKKTGLGLLRDPHLSW
ncbi:hypothetical protein [Achromobacter denitrificans]|uniref:hypothetical protein n=1 Tax=Achromobacter denitrificans TaxID=32002 RepID=UPI0018DFD5FA|nr:hypothetical protein [Achromobacter denitrificans]